MGIRGTGRRWVCTAWTKIDVSERYSALTYFGYGARLLRLPVQRALFNIASVICVSHACRRTRQYS